MRLRSVNGKVIIGGRTLSGDLEAEKDKHLLRHLQWIRCLQHCLPLPQNPKITLLGLVLPCVVFIYRKFGQIIKITFAFIFWKKYKIIKEFNIRMTELVYMNLLIAFKYHHFKVYSRLFLSLSVILVLIYLKKKLFPTWFTLKFWLKKISPNFH